MARVDLGAYLKLVGLPETGWRPTLAALQRLHRAHVAAIPFVNVPLALGRVPSLDLATVERRIVRERRGGTCLEQVPLFAAVLEALGFETELRISSEPWMAVADGNAASEEPRPPTHLVVLARVEDDDRRWMADVGWGVGVLGPVPLPRGPGAGEIVRHRRWEQHVEVADGRITLLERGPAPSSAEWRPCHVSPDVPLTNAAVDTANRFSALDPRSPFAGRLVAIRMTDDSRERLAGRRLEIYPGEGAATLEHLEPAAAVETLERRFGVVLGDDDRAGLLALLGKLEAPPPPPATERASSRDASLRLIEEARALDPGTLRGTETLDAISWDSMAALSFIALVDERVGRVVDAERLTRCKTVADLIAIIEAG